MRFASLIYPAGLPGCFVPVDVSLQGEQGQSKQGYVWWPNYEKGAVEEVWLEVLSQTATGQTITHYERMPAQMSGVLPQSATSTFG